MVSYPSGFAVIQAALNIAAQLIALLPGQNTLERGFGGFLKLSVLLKKIVQRRSCRGVAFHRLYICLPYFHSAPRTGAASPAP